MPPRARRTLTVPNRRRAPKKRTESGYRFRRGSVSTAPIGTAYSSSR